MPNEPNIDWGSIGVWEGTRLDMYVPVDAKGQVIGNSGPTIGTGVDLGAWNERDLRAIGLSDALLAKLRPYFQRHGAAALTYVEDHPLTITEPERVELDRAVQQHFVRELVAKYDAALKHIEFAWPVDQAKRFADLPRAMQTVIYSVAHQYGLGLDKRTPRFWKYATQQRWVKVIEELKNFGDQTPTRRGKEAATLEALVSARNDPMPVPKRPGSHVPAGTYTGQIVDGVPCGNGSWVYAEKPQGDTYAGECAQGMPWGQGKITFQNNDTFEGFVLGWTTGEGTFTWANGDRFIGGNPQQYWGQATILYRDGRVYEGGTRGGYTHGYGKMTYPDGRVEAGRWAQNGTRRPEPAPPGENFDTYEGPVIVGHLFGDAGSGYVKYKLDGEPVFASVKWAGNQKYEGGWSRSNEATGRGRFNDPKTGLSYTGNFRAGRLHGNGVLTVPEGSYEGQFENGWPEGNGSFVGTDGRKASGQWSRGRLHGRGTQQTSSGTYTGTFSQGTFDGVGRWESRDGKTILTGTFSVGAFVQGTGTWTSPGGDETYSGEWANGRANGQGEFTSPQGTKLEGTWRDGRLVTGTVRWPDGSRYEGPVRDDGVLADGRFFDAHGNELRDGSADREREHRGPVDRQRPDSNADRPEPDMTFCIREKDGPWVCSRGGMEF
jgi:hypothetical protein